MAIITKRFNAQRSAERQKARTGKFYNVERVEGGYQVVEVAPPATPILHHAGLDRSLLCCCSGSASTAGADDAERAAPVDAGPQIPAAPTAAKAAPVDMPTPPDFTANTHKPYRAKLAALIALVEAGDAEALAAFAIKPTSTSPKALIRYRDKAIAAIIASREAA